MAQDTEHVARVRVTHATEKQESRQHGTRRRHGYGFRHIFTEYLYIYTDMPTCKASVYLYTVSAHLHNMAQEAMAMASVYKRRAEGPDTKRVDDSGKVTLTSNKKIS